MTAHPTPAGMAAVVPVRPATAVSPAATVTGSLLRRTFGRDNPSRRTFGKSHP